MASKSITRKISIFINGKEVQNNLNSVGKAIGALRGQLKNLTPGTQKFIDKSKQLKQVKAQYRSIKQEIEGMPSIFKRLNKSVGGFMGAFGIGLGITGLISQIRNLTTANVRLEEAQADVMKTTGYTKQQVDALTVSLKKLNTKTPVEELLALAAAGGRLNLTGKELESYVKNTDKAFVALGDSLEGDAQQIGLSLGKIASQFNLEKKYGIGDSIGKIGSSLNELGAKSKATEGPILDFINKLAGVSAQAQIAEPDIAALGALFDENGQSIEVAATTFNKLLPAIGKDVERFAGIAGMNVKDFKKVVENDAFEALKLVAKGAKSNQKGLLGLTETLQGYGISNARAASIVSILSDKTDRLTALQKVSNTAFEQGTSLTNEFNIKNKTAGAIYAKIGKILENYFTGSKTQNFLKGIATGFYNLIKPTRDSTKAIKNEQIELIVAESKIKDVNTSNKDRLKLIKQLKEKYPKLLENINAEKVSNTELTTALREVNNQLVNKIILAKKDDEIFKQAKTTAAYKIDAIEAEKKARILLSKAQKEGAVIIEGTLKEQLTSAENQLRKSKKYYGVLGNLQVASDLYTASLRNLSKETDKSNALVSERKKLEEQLGITLDNNRSKTDKTITSDTTTPTTTTDTTSTTTTSGNTDGLTPEDKRIVASKKKVAEFLDQWNAEQDIKKQIEDLSKDEAAQLEEELRVEAKYAKLEEEANGEKDLLVRLEDAKQAELASVKKKWDDKFLADNKKYKQAERIQNEKAHKLQILQRKKLGKTIINSAVNLAGRETRVGQALLAAKGVLAAKEMLIQLGVIQGKAAGAVAEGTLATSVGYANTAKVGFPQNIPLLIAFAAQAVGIISAIKGAVGATKKIRTPSFYYGGYTGDSPIAYDQYGAITGAVHQNEYVIPEIITQDPTYAPVINMLEAKRTDSSSSTSTDVAAPSTQTQTNEMVTTAFYALIDKLSEPVIAQALIGDNEIERQKLRETKLNSTRNNAKVN